MQQISLIYYVDKNGNKPIKSFLDSLSQNQQAKTLRILKCIKEYGLQSVIPHLKKLTSTPLWEIRILGKDNIRILYVLEYQDTVLILHGFIKKTQKTKKKEIIIAFKRYYDWKTRKIAVDK